MPPLYFGNAPVTLTPALSHRRLVTRLTLSHFLNLFKKQSCRQTAAGMADLF